MRLATRLGLAALAFVLAAGAAQAQNVTFQVDMQRYIDSCQHDPASDVMEIRGNVFGWDDSAPDMTYDGDGTYSYSADFTAEEAISYKFFSTGGLGYEDQTGDRAYTVTADANQTVAEVTFADGDPVDACNSTAVEEDYEVTFAVDMSVQTARGAFDPATQVPGVAGALNGVDDWGSVAVPMQEDAFRDNIYTVLISEQQDADGGPVSLLTPGTSPYKFVILNRSDNSIAAWESGPDRLVTTTGEEMDVDNDNLQELAVAERFFNDVTASQVLQDAKTITFRVDMRSAAFYLEDNASIPGTPNASTSIDGVWINGPAMWESTEGGGPAGGISDWLGWGPTGLGANDNFAFSDDDNDNIWELTLNYPAGALTTLVGKLGLNANDNEGGFGNDSFYPIAESDGTINLVFGAMLKADGTYRDDCGPDADADGTCDPIYDPYILINNTATPPTVMAVDGTGEIDVANEQGPGLAEGVTLSAPRPNPAVGRVTFDLGLDRAMEVDVQVVDLMGRTIVTLAKGAFASGETELSLNASSLAAGVYVLRVQAGGEVVSRRMTVVR
ncbi:T9SS type A sorting domain-containing protein [Rubricoccus marinus]|uniref:T9SS type A sorting domain-containing protein n=1 Tax=Rubricoccus marinus TaxID=716817 RepID=UPI000B98F74A|nr:T9SS type A sorting domain-containing protein [Rubricoccus marinus]